MDAYKYIMESRAASLSHNTTMEQSLNKTGQTEVDKEYQQLMARKKRQSEEDLQEQALKRWKRQAGTYPNRYDGTAKTTVNTNTTSSAR